MLPNSRDWTEVQRKKTKVTHQGNNGLTTLYVARFLGGTNKSELWKIFSKFWTGSRCIFWMEQRLQEDQLCLRKRYGGVEDEKSLEDRVQGTRDVALHINLTLHKRKPNRTINQSVHQQRIIPPPPPPNSNKRSTNHVSEGKRDQHSFAQVLGELRGTPTSDILTIPLNPRTYMKDWIFKRTLTGEP